MWLAGFFLDYIIPKKRKRNVGTPTFLEPLAVFIKLFLGRIVYHVSMSLKGNQAFTFHFI